MQMQALLRRVFVFVAGITVMAFSGWASADPPSRVARLGYTAGAVSFSPSGENDWVRATINRPLTSGDRLWVDAGARAEIQVGGAMVRMSDGTGVSVLNLDDRIAQLQLTQGTLNVRVRRFEPNQVFEVDTPNLAFTLQQPGEYRIAVDPDGNATTIVVRQGRGEVYGEGAAYVVDSRQAYRFMGTGLREYQQVDTPHLDDFDRWASDRDRSYDNSSSARYVSQDVVGYQDLDANGVWRSDASYGNVWVPNRVAAGWAPYRDGHWAWVDPWGWTWVDDAPWGFAVSHYGRWANLRGTWVWVPGPVRTRAYYAPALVAFVGGANFVLTISSGNVGGVAWFPLGPREVYRPAYPTSRSYFENVNRSNTVINTTVINNTYNNTNVTNVVYVNRHVPGAVIAVPKTVFVQAQPVSRAAVRVSREMVASAPVAAIAPVAPTDRSLRGAAGPGDKQPPARVFERPVIARTAPPAAHAGFAAQQRQLAVTPGKPLDDAARRELKPAAAAPAPIVKVVAPAQVAPPTILPPVVAPAGRSGDGRGKADERKLPATPAVANAPAATPQATPPLPAAQPTERRGEFEQRGQPVVSPSAPAPAIQRAAEPKAVPPQVAPPAPVTQERPQRQMPPGVSRQPQAAPGAPSVPATLPPAKPEPAPAAVQAEPRRPVAAPKLPPSQIKPVPKKVPDIHVPKPADTKPIDVKDDNDEQKREEETRKKKGRSGQE